MAHIPTINVVATSAIGIEADIKACCLDAIKDKKLIRSEFRKNVKFKSEKFDIKSDKADYFEDKKQMVFYDNLTINSDNKKLVGDIFIYDLQKEMGFARTRSQTNKRVEIYFNDKK